MIVMRVVYLTNLPSPYRVEFFNEIARGGVELTVLYERRNASDRDEKWHSDEKDEYKTIFLKSKAIKGENSFSTDVIKYIKGLEYDLFIVHGYSTITAMIAIEYMRLKRIPFIISADGGLITKDKKIKEKIKRHFIGSAFAWLSTGKTTTGYFIHYGARKNRILEYPFSSLKNNDIEKPADSHEKKELRKRLGITDKKMVLFVGQYIYRKGIDVLLDTARRLQNIETGLYLVGGQPDEDIKKTVKDYKLDNVHFVPFKVKKELRDYYRAADVFTLPTREDIWGLVINEAMGYGLPVVSTKQCVAALTMVSEGESGFIVDSDDSDQLFEKMACLLKDEDLCRSFANKSYELAQQYTIEKMANRHLLIFNKLKAMSSKQV